MSENPQSSTTQEQAPAPEKQGGRGRQRTLVGHVVSDKMQKTVVVEVRRRVLDPVFKKFVRLREKFKAHDEKNSAKTGDLIEITESRRLSRDKRWRVSKILRRHVEA